MDIKFYKYQFVFLLRDFVETNFPFRYDFLKQIVAGMESLGWNPYAVDHEDANGQFEMNFEYTDCLETAHRHTFFKYMAKSVAENHGFKATFMPKPFADKSGSGCHVHISLWEEDQSSSTNVFLANEETSPLGLSDIGYRFMAGIIHNAEALCAFINPTVNSYKRICAQTTTSGATWAPNYISYTGNNRTHMIRIPEPGRFELRLGDGGANPYLLQAAILAAGIVGLENKRNPGERMDFNMYDVANAQYAQSLKKLPENLLDALRALEENVAFKKYLGERNVQSYVKLKKAEWHDYHGKISEWERENTLDI